MATVNFSLRLPAGLAKQIEHRAASDGVSRNEAIRRAIFCYLVPSDVEQGAEARIEALEEKVNALIVVYRRLEESEAQRSKKRKGFG